MNNTDAGVHTKASVVERDNADALAEISCHKLAEAVRKGEEDRVWFELVDILYRKGLSRIADLELAVAPLK